MIKIVCDLKMWYCCQESQSSSWNAVLKMILNTVQNMVLRVNTGLT